MDSSSTMSRTLTVSTSSIPELVEICLASHNNLLIVGNPGTGKSTIIKSMEQRGYKVTMLTGSSTYEETVNGIPYRDSANKSKTGNDMSVYNVPSWLEDICKHEGKQILFIDEFNTADPQVIKTFLSILTERKVPTQPDDLMIPEDCVIVAAMNPAEQNDGEQLIRPLKSRFMTVEIKSTMEDFKSYIVSNNDTDIPDDKLEYLLDALDKDRWGVEGKYNELNPRSFTNFIRALDSEIKAGREPADKCPELSMAFFGQAIQYPTESNVEMLKEQQKMEQIKKNPYPTREELELLSDNDLDEMYNKMVLKMTAKADAVCMMITDIKTERARNGSN